VVHFRVIGLVVAVLAALVAAGAAGYVFVLRTEPITIRVRGLEEDVPSGISAGEAAQRLDLEPEAGDLMDVQGGVIRPGVFPGRYLVDGRTVSPATELENGDSLRTIDGSDRMEPSVLLHVRVPGGMPSNPQFTLARSPGEHELARGKLSGKVASRGFHATGPSRSPRAVALTFDDGPSPYTQKILAVLDRFRARATFFVVGRLADEYPGLVRRELARGMSVGSHSYSHPYRPPFDRQPHSVIVGEIAHAREVVESLGRAPTLFRPPGGSFSEYVVEAAGGDGQRVVLWSVDPTDWQGGVTPKQIVRRVLGAVRPGSIVLLHDGGGDQSATVQALSRIIRGIRRKGLRLALID
jgi:peptidoglycan/xylan/chitin deacetylase (PgdA/CDA1 family)